MSVNSFSQLIFTCYPLPPFNKNLKLVSRFFRDTSMQQKLGNSQILSIIHWFCFFRAFQFLPFILFDPYAHSYSQEILKHFLLRKNIRKMDFVNCKAPIDKAELKAGVRLSFSLLSRRTCSRRINPICAFCSIIRTRTHKVI